MASANQSGYWAICDMIAKYRQSVTYRHSTYKQDPMIPDYS